MLDLDDAESYAAAALFALATYCTASEAGVTQNSSVAGSWGLPFEEVCNAYCEPSRKARHESAWGWHAVSPAGLCGGVFHETGIKPSTCPGVLSAIDAIAPLTNNESKSNLCDLVQVYACILDPGLEFKQESAQSAIHQVEVATDSAPESRLGRSDSAPKSLLDEDPPTPRPEPAQDDLQPQSSDTDLLDEPPMTTAEVHEREEDALRKALNELGQSPDAMARIDAENRCFECAMLTEGVLLPEPAFTPANLYVHKPTSKSIAALQATISGCIPTTRPPPSDPTAPPLVRWYDARARIACMRLAHWLCVPMPTFCALEMAVISKWAVEDVPSSTHSHKKLHAYHSKMGKYAKMGAAAVTGGALMAVTAGLAAPAIVAGFGAAVGLTGSAGAAAAISGAAATSASVGIVSGGMGAGGAAYYSSKMARRAADVVEFGFVSLPTWEAWRACLDEAAAAADASATEAVGSGSNGALTRDGSSQSLGITSTSVTSTGGSGRLSDDSQEQKTGDPGKQRASRLKKQISRTISSRRRSATGEVPVGSGSSVTSQGRSAVIKEKGAWGNFKYRWTGSTDTPELVEQVDGTIMRDPLLNLLDVPVPADGSVRAGVTIAVNGWIDTREDYLKPWSSLPKKHGDTYALVWESKELLEVGRAFMKLLVKGSGQQAITLALSTTMYGLVAALTWPAAALGAASFIDTAWDVASNRAIKSGKLMAHMLMAKGHGDRPVTLVGVSLGARVVLYCLLELYKHNACGIVEHAVLLGTPSTTSTVRWQMARRVVAGRLINGYSTSDWLLALCYRTSIGGQGLINTIAGMSPVGVAGVENLNLTDSVKTHADYCKKMEHIHRLINLRDE